MRYGHAPAFLSFSPIPAKLAAAADFLAEPMLLEPFDGSAADHLFHVGL
jgi:hypothetical protein